MTIMKNILHSAILLVSLSLTLSGCQRGSQTPQAGQTPSAANQTPSESILITLPGLNALFNDKIFTAALKSKLQLTDEQIAALRKISSDELARLGSASAETQTPAAAEARARAQKSIRDLIGNEKAEQLWALALERRSSQPETIVNVPELTQLKGPNAVPPDTRIVVNIPAFRMDLFRDGTLLKSFKIGIGYQQYPLPTGFRKAEMIIFNPTWTQPNEPWATSPGEVVAAGAKGNPLGPIKVPIGGANLIHGGKELWKIGTFASHGCVGMTNEQVKDFTKTLARASNTELSDQTMATYLKNRTRTRVVKLTNLVPVELRYETIVVEDGKLHIYRDVYDQNTNTEENLRVVLEKNGIKFADLSDDEKTRTLEALNMFSRHPKKQPTPKPSVVANVNAADKAAAAAERKAEAERQKKLRNQKEIVIEITTITSNGYPAPKDLDSGTGTAVATTAVAVTKP
jgi:L,D-transpeptidase ErfK/SrfK